MFETAATKESPFICHITGCSRSFRQKEHLKRHQATHAGLRLHQCPTCSRAFTRSDTLNRHILVQTNPPERSKRIPIACQICRKRKTKCDAGEPCLACCNMRIPCVRTASSSQDALDSVTKIDLLRSTCEGPMAQAQAMREALSDKSKMHSVPGSSQIPVGYPLEQQGIMANAALPGDMAGGMLSECVQRVNVHSSVPLSTFDLSFDYEEIDGY